MKKLTRYTPRILTVLSGVLVLVTAVLGLKLIMTRAAIPFAFALGLAGLMAGALFAFDDHRRNAQQGQDESGWPPRERRRLVFTSEDPPGGKRDAGGLQS